MKMEKFLHFFYGVVPWIHLCLVVFCFSGSLEISTNSYYELVESKYNVALTNDLSARADMDFLGSSIRRRDRQMRIAIILLILTLPLNFFVCHHSKKLLKNNEPA